MIPRTIIKVTIKFQNIVKKRWTNFMFQTIKKEQKKFSFVSHFHLVFFHLLPRNKKERRNFFIFYLFSSHNTCENVNPNVYASTHELLWYARKFSLTFSLFPPDLTLSYYMSNKEAALACLKSHFMMSQNLYFYSLFLFLLFFALACAFECKKARYHL